MPHNNTATSRATRVHVFRTIDCSIERASAQPGRRRADADALPELGFQSDRGKTGAAGHPADAAGHDPLHGRSAVVALGSYQFLGERLRASQWGGLGLSFAGVALAIGVPQANVDANVLLGDLMIVAGGALWAATTLLVKATALLQAPPEKALGYQVALSIPILGAAAWISGETITRLPGLLALSLMAYQAIWVVGLTFLLWFTLVKTYSASKLSAFTFITPLFGVVASYFIMHDTLTPVFGAAALLVIAGLYLVNRPDASGPKLVPDPNVPA